MKSKSKICKDIKNEEGFALILTLWVLMILSVLILTYSMSVNSNIKNASYLKDKMQASAYAEGVLYLAAVNLIYPDDDKKKSDSSIGDSSGTDDSSNSSSTDSNSTDGKSNTESNKTAKVDPKQVEWYYEKLGRWHIDPKKWTISKDEISGNNVFAGENPNIVMLVCEVFAEDAKFPLNKITQFKEAPTATDMSPVVFSAIKDYLKKIKKKQGSTSSSGTGSGSNTDSNTNSDSTSGASGTGTTSNTGSGTSSGSDSTQGQSSDKTKDEDKDSYGSFTCVEQLLEVDNVDADVYDGSIGTPGLKDIMTVFSDGKVYVNKAKENVLSMVPGISSGAAGQIASQAATGNYLKSFDDLNSMIGANSADTSKAEKWLTLIPKYFRIKAKATVHGITCIAECVVKVEKNNIEFVLTNRG